MTERPRCGGLHRPAPVRHTKPVAREEHASAHPVTPDGRYFVVRGRLWRRTDPSLAEPERERLVRELMAARRAVKEARAGRGGMAAARSAVDRAKRGLGERGPVWWTDGEPDLNRHMVANTPYAAWHAELVGS